MNSSANLSWSGSPQTTGVLLVNLGTPEAPTTKALHSYLKQFLMDPHVINLPWPLRVLLVYGIILPFRSSRSAEKYKKIWWPEGSPLRVLSESLKWGLQEEFKKKQIPGAPQIPVELAMRYGEPSVEQGIQSLLKSCDAIQVLPLFPQYAEATTGSIRDEVDRAWKKIQRLSPPSPGGGVKKIDFIPHFYSEDFFIQSYEKRLSEVWDKRKRASNEHLLFSFHGLPQKQILKNSHCQLNNHCCVPVPAHCYYAQCLSTAQKIATSLKWPQSQWSVSFQSRLGRGTWLSPYTDQELIRLAQNGVRQVRVVCPSFVTDCLETLEEMGIENRRLFLDSGGLSYELAPCLNDHPVWIHSLADWILKTISG